MSQGQLLTNSSRSEGAKKMWERRKAKEETMTTPAPMKAWVYHTEWVTLMATVITCFIFVFHESNRTNDRLDKHIEAINRRSDQICSDINKRCDELNARSDRLHQEFIDLLKEKRREG